VHNAGYYRNGKVGVRCIVLGIFEMEPLGYCVQCRILLKWGSWGTVCSAG